MPRPRKKRRCRHYEGDRVFKPRSVPMTELEVEHLAVDELEAMRLCDLDALDQEAAGDRMGVSRGTVQRLLKAGRATLVRTLVENRALVVGGDAAEEREDEEP
jgi:predicted DNA-binding protein (UPF0251 family)